MTALNAGVWAIAAALSAAAPADTEPESSTEVADAAPAEETSEPEASEPEELGVARLRGRVFVYGDRDPAAGARLLPKDGSTPIDTDEEGAFSADLRR